MKLLITTQTVDINDPILAFFIGWIKEFSKHFEHIHVICLKEGKHELPENVTIHSLGKECGQNRLKYTWRFYKYFWQLYMNGHVDYVFFHMGAVYNIMAAPFFLIRKIKKTKFYWWKAHGHINKFGRFALNFVDRVYTSTESGFPIDTPKRHIVGQATDTAAYSLPSDNSIRSKEVIYVGRISSIKRIEDFIDTASILHKKDTQITFTIIGPLDDEEYVSKMQNKVNDLELQNVVTFTGHKNQKELAAIRQKASVFLNTSVTHSMDKTVLSAALCGCLPVTSNNAFIELLQPYELYIKDASAQQYADLIFSLLQQDTLQLRKKLHDDVVRLHSLDTFSDRVFE